MKTKDDYPSLFPPKVEPEKAPVPLEVIYSQKKAGVGRSGYNRKAFSAEQIIRDLHLGKLATRRNVEGGSNNLENERAAIRVAEHYAVRYQRYMKQQYRMSSTKMVKSSLGNLAAFSRAAAQIEELAVPIEDFIEAQFYWIDYYFSRPPRFNELGSVKARSRYMTWKMLREEGQASEPITPVDYHISQVKNGDLDLMEYELRLLNRMIRQWGSEETVWEMFGTVGFEEAFSDNFKRTRPIWRAMYHQL